MKSKVLFITDDSFSLDNATPSPAIFETDETKPLKIQRAIATATADIDGILLRKIFVYDLNENIKTIRVFYTTSNSANPIEVGVII